MLGNLSLSPEMGRFRSDGSPICLNLQFSVCGALDQAFEGRVVCVSGFVGAPRQRIIECVKLLGARMEDRLRCALFALTVVLRGATWVEGGNAFARVCVNCVCDPRLTNDGRVCGAAVVPPLTSFAVSPRVINTSVQLSGRYPLCRRVGLKDA